MIRLSAPASFAPAAAGLPKRLQGVAYSGDRVPERNLVIDLATTRVTTPAPLLAGHSPGAVVGRVVKAAAGSSLSIEGELYSDIDPEARAIAEKAQRGHPWQLSVGLFDYRSEEVPAGRSILVNGRSVVGPVAVLRGGQVREVSVVALGADPATSASFFGHPGQLDVHAQAAASTSRMQAERGLLFAAAARSSGAFGGPAQQLGPDRTLDTYTKLSAVFGDVGARQLVAMYPGLQFRLDASSWTLVEAAVGPLVAAVARQRFEGATLVVPKALG